MEIKALIVKALSVIIFTVGAATMQASIFPFAGTFPGDDSVELFSITVGPDSSLVAQTFGYAGGTNGKGTVIPAGGFDPVLSLFDPTGALIQINDDGGCGVVGKDPITGTCFDSFLSQTNLTTPGVYTLALTEAPNQAQDNLGQPDTFIFPPGTGNFTCAMFGPGAPTAPFCDITGAQRNGDWALDISGSAVLSATNITNATPEPSYQLLVLGGLAGLALLRAFRRTGSRA